MPIMPKLLGRWTKRREGRIAGLWSAIPSKHWTNYRQLVPSFENNCQPVRHPILEHLEAGIRQALNPKEAYHMMPGKDPETV